MELPAVKKFLGDMLPFHKEVSVPLLFPGLFMHFEVNINVEAPIGVQISANVEQNMEFRYSEMLTQEFTFGGGAKITTTNARPSVNFPAPAVAAAVSGFGALRLSRADISLGLCFGLGGGKKSALSCAKLQAKTTTDLFTVGFDLQTKTQADLAENVKMVNPMVPNYEGYDFAGCAALIGKGKTDLIAMGTFFTVDKPTTTVSYDLPAQSSIGKLGCIVTIPDDGILFKVCAAAPLIRPPPQQSLGNC